MFGEDYLARSGGGVAMILALPYGYRVYSWDSEVGGGMCRNDAPAALPRPHCMMKLEKIFLFKVILFN